MSENLLSTLADVLDIREVLPRVSDILAGVLPHDRMTVGFADGEDEFVTHASSNDDGPSIQRAKISNPDQFTAAGFTLVRDLAHEMLPVIEPVDAREQLLASGYRSLLIAHTSTRFQELSVGFWSKQPNAFSMRDVPVARRAADCVGLVLSHQQLADAERRAAEARARAERLEVRVKSLAVELDLRSGLGRATETTDLNEVERRTIGHVMRETRGNKSKAAKRLGLTRTQLYGRLRKYGLDSADL